MWIDPRIQGRLRELMESSGQLLEKDISKAIELASEAFHNATATNDPLEIATASLCLGKAQLAAGRLKESEQLLLHAKAYCEAAQDIRLLAQVNIILAQCFITSDDISKCEQLLLASVRLCEEHEQQDELREVLHALAITYARQNRLNDAVQTAYRYKSLVDALEPGTRGSMEIVLSQIHVNNLLGGLLGSLGDLQASRNFFEQELALALSSGLIHRASNAYFNLGCSYYNEGDYDQSINYTLQALAVNASEPEIRYKIHQLDGLSECYIKKEDFDSAEAAIDEALALSQGAGDILLSSLLHKKGIIRLARKDREGITYLLKALHIYQDSGQVIMLDGLLADIWQYYKEIGDYEHALQFHEQYLGLIKKNSDEKQHALSKVEVERREQDKRIFALELEQKESRLRNQERELAFTASQLATQADLLSHFRNDLRKIVREMADPIDALREIKTKLKDLPCEQIDWAKFEADFVVVHPEFRSLLAERFPELTPQETKMCMLVRLGLRNAEIARLTCLSERTVDNHRFNLRKKLGLRTEQNLTQFLVAIK